MFPLKAVLDRWGEKKIKKLVDRGFANISLESLLVRREELWAEPTGTPKSPLNIAVLRGFRSEEKEKDLIFLPVCYSFTATLV